MTNLSIGLVRRCAAIFGSILVAAPVSAQTDPHNFSTAETEFHQRTAQLRRHEAIAGLLAELTTCSAALVQPEPTRADRRRASFAEYAASQVILLANGFADPRRIRAAFLKLAESPLARAFPCYRDMLWIHALARGRTADDETPSRDVLVQRLGFLQDWWLLGPFDNERGSGFDRRTGAASKFSPGRTYPGKKRDLRWRPLPHRPIRGRIELQTMVQPHCQVWCLLATALVADRDRDVALRLGSSEAFEVILNGEPVGGASLRRSFAFDQNTVVLPLRAGANYLVLRVFTQEGGMTCAARLCELSGRTLSGVTVRAAAADLDAAASQRPRQRDRNAPAPQLGARGKTEDGGFDQEDPTEGAADGFRLAAVLAFYHAEDQGDDRVRSLLRRAVSGLPKSPAPRYALATARIRGGRSVADREDNPRRQDYEAILRDHPGHGRALLALARMDLDSIGTTDAAVRRLRKASKVAPDSRPLHLAKSQALHSQGLLALSERELLAAATPDGHGNILTAALRRLARNDAARARFAAARTRFQTLLDREDRPSDRVALARVLLRSGHRDEAVQLLEEGLRAWPFYSELCYPLSRLLEAEGKPTEAMRPLQHRLRICPEDDDALGELARLYGLLGQRDRQRETLHDLVELNPNRKDERRLLEYLEAKSRPFYAGQVRDPAKVIAADPGAPADADQAEDPFYYLLDQRVVHAYRNGTASHYRHYILRILTDAGSRRHTQVRVPHYRGEQRARLLSVAVHKADGSVRRPRIRGSAADLPTLAIGDILDVSYRVDDTAPGFFGDYFGFEHLFTHRQPTRIAALTVILDPGREYRLQTANGAPQPLVTEGSDGRVTWQFELANLERSAVETAQPAPSESKPLVRITTYPSWNAFATWWWNLIQDQSEVSPAIRAKVHELVQGMTSKREQIDAIYRFVTTEVRYKAWEFGVHGYKPYSTPVIFERRHGDCKDKSLLLNCMLGVIGVKASPVLIHADTPRSRDDLSLPMVQHFNHCISYVEATDASPGMFLDGTATYHPLDTLPAMDWGAEVLVVRGPKAEIRRIPWPDADANREQSSLTVNLQPNGDATCSLRMRPTLNQAVSVREYLGNEPAKRQERLAEFLRGDFGAVTIEALETSDPLDLDRAVDLKIDFRAPGFAVRQDRGLVLPSAVKPAPLLRYALAESRTEPLLLGLPGSHARAIRYVLPPGYDATSLPALTEYKTAFGTFRLEWKRDREALLVTRELRIQVERVEPADYAAFRVFAAQVDEASQQVVVIRRKDGPR